MRNKLALIRKENKISQEELATVVGVTRQTVYAIEKGKFVPTVVTAIKIAQFFGLTVEDIFSPEDEWYKYYIETADENASLILGQGLSAYKDLKYKKFSFAFNGGEIAAVYNALVLMGKRPSLPSLIEEFEINRMAVLSGFAGTDPRRLFEFFEGHGIPYEKLTPAHVEGAKEGDILIISYCFNSLIKPLRGIHTVCGTVKDGDFVVYNLSDGDIEPTIFESFSDFLKKHSIICGYIFK